MFTLDTYSRFLFDDYYHVIIYDTLRMATLVTVLSLLIGYPLAYALWRINRPSMQRWLGLLIFSPILVSVVVRSYGWTVLLVGSGAGELAAAAARHRRRAGDARVQSRSASCISLTHVFLPFVVFPIFSSLTRLDPALKEAAEDLGAGWWTTFRRITLPLSLPGVVAGAQICFTLALGAFVTPAMLGGGRVLVLPLQVYNATSDINWPVAAVGGMVLLIIVDDRRRGVQSPPEVQRGAVMARDRAASRPPWRYARALAPSRSRRRCSSSRRSPSWC